MTAKKHTLVIEVAVTEADALDGVSERTVILRGRDAWAFRELYNAGATGCTPITRPAPRWSHYVHQMRHVHGIQVSTEHESHGGLYSGTHARYRLETRCRIVSVSDPAREVAA